MVKSPLRVFAYWELEEATIQRALSGISTQERQNFQLLLKWKERDAGRDRCLDPGTTDSWWFDTLPEHRYQMELGLYWAEYGWLPLLSSRELTTPRRALGPASRAEPPRIHAFLENWVEQTGIISQPEKTPSQPPTNLERQPPEGETIEFDKTSSRERHPEGLSRRIPE